MAKEGKVITFINEKGGIGKSSSCFNVAWEMSKRKKILLIDLDGQKANLTFFTGVEKTGGMITMVNVLSEDRDVHDAIKEVKENLYIVPANTSVTDLSQKIRITKMKHVVETLKSEYDYIFIDVNPTPNWSHVLSLSGSDYVIIPMLPDIASLEANKGIAESIEEVQMTTNSKLKPLGILFNKNTNRTNLSKQVKAVADKVAAQLGTTVFETKIRDAVALSENIGLHMGVTEYNPKSAVAGDIVELCKEIERRIKNDEV